MGDGTESGIPIADRCPPRLLIAREGQLQGIALIRDAIAKRAAFRSALYGAMYALRWLKHARRSAASMKP